MCTEARTYKHNFDASNGPLIRMLKEIGTGLGPWTSLHDLPETDVLSTAIPRSATECTRSALTVNALGCSVTSHSVAGEQRPTQELSGMGARPLSCDSLP